MGNCLGFLWEFFVNSLGIDLSVEILVFCQDFVSVEKEGGRKDKKFKSLELQEASSSHLKNVENRNSIVQSYNSPREVGKNLDSLGLRLLAIYCS